MYNKVKCVFQMYLAHRLSLKYTTSVLIQSLYHGQKVSMGVLIKPFTMKSELTTRIGRCLQWKQLKHPTQAISGIQQSTTWLKEPPTISAYIPKTVVAKAISLSSANLRQVVCDVFVLYISEEHFFHLQKVMI